MKLNKLESRNQWEPDGAALCQLFPAQTDMYLAVLDFLERRKPEYPKKTFGASRWNEIK